MPLPCRACPSPLGTCSSDALTLPFSKRTPNFLQSSQLSSASTPPKPLHEYQVSPASSPSPDRYLDSAKRATISPESSKRRRMPHKRDENPVRPPDDLRQKAFQRQVRQRQRLQPGRPFQSQTQMQMPQTLNQQFSRTP